MACRMPGDMFMQVAFFCDCFEHFVARGQRGHVKDVFRAFLCTPAAENVQCDGE